MLIIGYTYYCAYPLPCTYYYVNIILYALITHTLYYTTACIVSCYCIPSYYLSIDYQLKGEHSRTKFVYLSDKYMSKDPKVRVCMPIYMLV